MMPNPAPSMWLRNDLSFVFLCSADSISISAPCTRLSLCSQTTLDTIHPLLSSKTFPPHTSQPLLIFPTIYTNTLSVTVKRENTSPHKGLVYRSSTTIFTTLLNFRYCINFRILLYTCYYSPILK